MRFIIALTGILSVALLSSFVASGLATASQARQTSDEETAALTQDLPPLGNTPAADRLMLREIGDQHIFDGQNSMTSGTIRRASDGQIAQDNSMPLQPWRHRVRSPHTDEPNVVNHDADAVAAIKQNTAGTVWQFVQQSTRLDIPDNEKIANYREQYRAEAMWISKILNRATPFVGHIVEELDKRYLPLELALLPAIESGYQPDVFSAEEAAGIWQIIPATAKEIGLARTQWFDGRSDIVASTTAAIDYLSYLNAEFHGDWLLTLAAYNAGLGRVRNAIRKNEKQDLPTDFWSLPLPRETRNYVPKFLALVAMLRYDTAPQFEIPIIERGNGFEQINVGQRVSLDKVAQISQVNEKTLRRLNASLVHAITPPQGPHIINVPLGQGDAILSSLSGIDAAQIVSLPATHTVTAGETLSGIARQYGVSQRHLIHMNALTGSLIRIGQQLAIRDESSGKDSIEYVVTIGDTLSEIAQRFSVSIRNIRDAQGEALTSDVIHPGVRLSILISSLETG